MSRKSDKHAKEVYLQTLEAGALEGPIEGVILRLQQILDDAKREGYYEIRLKEEQIDFEWSEVTVVAMRAETKEEREKRLKKQKAERERRQKQREESEAADRALYESLKARFEHDER